jgi:hypothetical protein
MRNLVGYIDSRGPPPKRRGPHEKGCCLNTFLTISFGAHVSLDDVASMISSISAYGNVMVGDSERDFSIEVFQDSKLPRLKMQLANWEQCGFLNWSEDNSN